MAKKRGNPDNLVPFKPGFDERRNADGRPPGSQSLKDIFERFLAIRTKIEGDEPGTVLDITKKEAIAFNLIADALIDEDPNIRLKAAKVIFETTDPQAKEVKHSGNPDNPIVFDFSSLTKEERAQHLAIIEKVGGGK